MPEMKELVSELKPQLAPFKLPGGSNVVDMTTRKWGALTAIRKGGGFYWWFRCDAGHEGLVNATSVRRATRLHEEGKGEPMGCPQCPKQRARQNNARRKLSDEDIVDIRRREGEDARLLAAEYGVTDTTIYRIRNHTLRTEGTCPRVTRK